MTTPGAKGWSITSQVRLREQQLVLVQLVLLRLVVQGHLLRLELQQLVQRPVRL